MASFVRRHAQRSDRWGVIHVCRKAEPLTRRIVVVPEKIIGFDDINIMDLGSLQDLTRGFGAADVRAGPDFTPFAEGTTNADLRPNTDDKGHADVQKPVTAKAETARVKHVYLK